MASWALLLYFKIYYK